MYVIAVAGQKGGAGKTTIAVHLAVAAVAAGHRVGMIDADPQGSATAWAKARPAAAPALPVAPLVGADVERGIKAARADGFEVLVIDTPPHAARAAAAALQAADLVLLPVRPSVLDLAALPAGLALVDAAASPALVVLSAVPSRCAEEAEVRAAIEAAAREVASVVIHDRVDFRRALATGRAVAETFPTGLAAREIRALWREVARRIGIQISKETEA
jgi:chromosome partitioning protein